MTKKAEKKIRQDAILNALLEGTFNKDHLAQKFHVLERTIRRDLNEIAGNLGPFDERLSILRRKALDTLGPRIKEMSDRDLIKLISIGMVQKVETEIKGPIELKWKE